MYIKVNLTVNGNELRKFGSFLGMEYRVEKLRELSQYIVRGITPKYTEDLKGIFVANQKCIRNYKLNLGNARIHDINKKGITNEKIVQKYDILINSTGVGTAGRVAQNFEDKRFTVDSHVTIVRPDITKIDPVYLGYILKNKQIDIERLAEGSTGQTEISRQRLGEEIVIRYPKNIETQKKMSNILLRLDQKIQLNNQINDNLHELVESIFNEIYQSGEAYKLENLIANISTGSRPKGGAQKKGIPSIGAEKIEKFGKYDYHSEKYISEDYFNTLKKGVVKSEDVLLYKDGAYTGKVTMALNGFPHEKCAVNEHVFILNTKNNWAKFYLYFLLNNHENKTKIFAMANGKAAQPGLNQMELKSLDVKLAPEYKIVEFEKRVEPIMNKIICNAKENRKLEQLRNILLPKLINGEIKLCNCK